MTSKVTQETIDQLRFGIFPSDMLRFNITIKEDEYLRLVWAGSVYNLLINARNNDIEVEIPPQNDYHRSMETFLVDGELVESLEDLTWSILRKITTNTYEHHIITVRRR